jgi:5-(carboxyamino)imidazole ribonucleotide mutase
MPTPSVSLICGSRSDFTTLEAGGAILDELGVPHELRVISAHRAPALLDEYITDAQQRGVRVFICAAGLAAHLAGAVAARSPWPVIGVPMPGGVSDGLDALLSTVQMPKGVPVASVGVGRADNAAILAAQILSVGDDVLAQRIVDYRTAQTQKILDDPTNQPAA